MHGVYHATMVLLQQVHARVARSRGDTRCGTRHVRTLTFLRHSPGGFGRGRLTTRGFFSRVFLEFVSTHARVWRSCVACVHVSGRNVFFLHISLPNHRMDYVAVSRVAPDLHHGVVSLFQNRENKPLVRDVYGLVMNHAPRVWRALRTTTSGTHPRFDLDEEGLGGPVQFSITSAGKLIVFGLHVATESQVCLCEEADAFIERTENQPHTDVATLPLCPQHFFMQVAIETDETESRFTCDELHLTWGSHLVDELFSFPPPSNYPCTRVSN